MAKIVADIYDHAVSLFDEVPHATGIGVAFIERDEKLYGLALAIVINDQHGRPIDATRLVGAAIDEDDVRRLRELAAIRSVMVAHRELHRALAAR